MLAAIIAAICIVLFIILFQGNKPPALAVDAIVEEVKKPVNTVYTPKWKNDIYGITSPDGSNIYDDNMVIYNRDVDIPLIFTYPRDKNVNMSTIEFTITLTSNILGYDEQSVKFFGNKNQSEYYPSNNYPFENTLFKSPSYTYVVNMKGIIEKDGIYNATITAKLNNSEKESVIFTFTISSNSTLSNIYAPFSKITSVGSCNNNNGIINTTVSWKKTSSSIPSNAYSYILHQISDSVIYYGPFAFDTSITDVSFIPNVPTTFLISALLDDNVSKPITRGTNYDITCSTIVTSLKYKLLIFTTSNYVIFIVSIQ